PPFSPLHPPRRLAPHGVDAGSSHSPWLGECRRGVSPRRHASRRSARRDAVWRNHHRAPTWRIAADEGRSCHRECSWAARCHDIQEASRVELILNLCSQLLPNAKLALDVTRTNTQSSFLP